MTRGGTRMVGFIIAYGMLLFSGCRQQEWEIQFVTKMEKSAFAPEVREWLPSEGCWLALNDFWMTELRKQYPTLNGDTEWALVMTNGYPVDLKRSNTAMFYRERDTAADPERYFVYRYPKRFYPAMGPGTQSSLVE